MIKVSISLVFSQGKTKGENPGKVGRMKKVSRLVGRFVRSACVRLTLFVGACLALVGQAQAVDYDPATDIAAIQATVVGFVGTGAGAVVAVLTAGLGIAAVIWIVRKAKRALFGS